MKSSVYTYSDGNTVYLSEVSKENAFEKYLEQAILDEVYTLEEGEALWSGFSCKNEVIDAEITAPEILDVTTEIAECDLLNKGTICGTLYWEDDNGANHALRRVMVNIYTKVSGFNIYLATTYTDNNGYFEKDILPCENVFIRAYAGDGNVIVGSGIHQWWYAYTFSKMYNVSASSVTTVDFEPIPVSTDVGKAMQIAQAALTARDYAWIMMNEKPNMITIVYPSSEPICCYSTRYRQMHIVNGISNDGKLTSYASWDAIMHEYGHHIQAIMNNANNPGLSHDSLANDADAYQSKDIGVRLAWAESWPTVFGILVQDYYACYLPIAEDKLYTAYNNNSYDISSIRAKRGEACERSIMAILWDVYDEDSSDDSVLDNLSLAHQAFWNLTTKTGTYTFSDFMENFYEAYPEYIYEIAHNLAKYKMATTMPSVSYSGIISINNPITLNWIAQGGSTNYPNNRFSIVVYKNDEKVFEKENVLTSTYTFSLSEWQEILSDCGYICGEELKMHIAILAYQDDGASYTTGPYYSPLQSITINHTCRYEYLNTTSHSYTCDDCGNTGTISHDSIYINCGASSHTKVCTDCGYTLIESHDLTHSEYNNSSHTSECSECGYSGESDHDLRFKFCVDWRYHAYKCVDCGYVDEDSLASHSYDYWVYLNPTTHISECTCGARGTTTAPHAFVAPDIFSLERVCVGCGYTKIAGSDIGQIILSIQKVSLNGSYILPDGNIVLVDEDVEAYLNGTLVFYDKDNLPVTQ